MTAPPVRPRSAPSGEGVPTRGAPPPAASIDRFAFGANWRSFVRTVDEDRVRASVDALAAMLGPQRLEGRTFVDVGSGSGLASLAAVRLNARRVHSFDNDSDSVASTRLLRDRSAVSGDRWTIEHGDILDEDYVATLGQFDVVYSWGVLHHTGRMWSALEHTVGLVAPGGTLFVALYNDQGGTSRRWRSVKRLYNRLPRLLRPLLAAWVGIWFQGRTALIRLLRRQNPLGFADSFRMKRERGMSMWHDVVDWAGGYPFEVAKPEEVFDFCRDRGFVLERLKTNAGGHGCNEFVFNRAA
jgi:2-polyprenyl-3-methyl-5-hydroxy-6-metoxy-1,4-benzoquinol methylase